MDRPKSTRSKRFSTMLAPWAGAFECLLPTVQRKRDQSETHAADRRAVHQNTFLWRTTHHGLAPTKWAPCQCKTSKASDEENGHRGHLSEAKSVQTNGWAQDLPILAAQRSHNASRSGLEHRYHIHPTAARLHLLGGGNRLVQPICASLGSVSIPRRRLLFDLTRLGSTVQKARDLQLGPGFTVHVERVHRTSEGQGDTDKHGRPWPRIGQCVRRKAMAIPKIRGGIFARLQDCSGSRKAHTILLSILQRRTTAPVTSVSDSSGSIRPRPGLIGILCARESTTSMPPENAPFSWQDNPCRGAVDNCLAIA